MRIIAYIFFAFLLFFLATSSVNSNNKQPEFSVEDEVNHLIGLNFIRHIKSNLSFGSRISPDLSCTTTGIGGSFRFEYRNRTAGYRTLMCKDREVLVLITTEFVNDDIVVYQIRDAMLLPTEIHHADGKTSEVGRVGEEFFCEIDGKPEVFPENYFFLARSDVLRQTEYVELDYNEPLSIEYAWFLDLNAKIKEFDANRVTCFRL